MQWKRDWCLSPKLVLTTSLLTMSMTDRCVPTEQGPTVLRYEPCGAYSPTSLALARAPPSTCDACNLCLGLDGKEHPLTGPDGVPIEPDESQEKHSEPGGCQEVPVYTPAPKRRRLSSDAMPGPSLHDLKRLYKWYQSVSMQEVTHLGGAEVSDCWRDARKQIRSFETFRGNPSVIGLISAMYWQYMSFDGRASRRVTV